MSSRRRGRAIVIALVAALATTAGLAPRALAASAAPATPLQSAWDSVLAQPGISHALIGGDAYDVTTHTTLASVDPDWRLTPGSVTKLYSSAAALSQIGSDFALTTTVDEAGPGGALYLVGGGEFFDGPYGLPRDGTLAALAQTVASRVHGASQVVGVGSLFDGWTSGPGWDISEVAAPGDPSVSALTSDADELDVDVSPGARTGAAPTVRIDPGHPALAPAAGYTVVDDAMTGAADSSDTLFVRCLPNTNTIVLSGTVPAGATAAQDAVAIGDPTLFTAALFEADLRADGVQIAEPATTGPLADGAETVGSDTSPLSLRSYLRTQNGWSINEMAETLYRLLGAHASGTGSPQASAAAISAFLHAAGLSDDRVQVDGSGLSPLDEMSAAQVTELLAYVARQPYFDTFEHSLIHIGHTHHCTFLCGYMDGTAADGTVWLKTGNLANQWNYAGYAHAKNGDLIAFTLFFDGLNEDDPLGESVGPIDTMTEDAASWPDEPAATTSATSSAGEATASRDDDGSLPASASAQLPSAAVQDVDRASAAGDVVTASVRDVASGTVLAQADGGLELQGGLLGRLATVGTFLHDAPGLTLDGPAVKTSGSVTGGVLHGSLVLDGGDDPLLSTGQLTDLATSLAHAGVTSTSGPLEYDAGDDEPFGDEPQGVSNMPFSTPYEDVGASFAPPASPLVAGEDEVSLTVQGAASAGTPATVSVSPAGSPVTLDGAIATSSSPATPAAVWNEGSGAYDLSGSVAPGQTTTLTVAPPDPALVAADQFAAALRVAGISVPGSPVALTSDPATRTLASEPAPSPAAEAQTALTDPSDVAPFDMYSQLGDQAGNDLHALVGSKDQIIDPSGNGAYDYLTANSITRMLATVHSDPDAAPLVSELSSPWVVTLPERTTLAGYATDRGGRLVAYAVDINGQLFGPGADLPSEYEPVIDGAGGE